MMLSLVFALLSPTTPPVAIEPIVIEPLPLASSLYLLEDADADKDLGWRGQFNAGLQVVTGNTSTVNANAGFVSMKDYDKDLLTIRGDWFYTEQNQGNGQNPPLVGGVSVAPGVTQRTWTASAQYDHAIDDKTYGFGTVAAMNNGLADLTLRASAGVGVGHTFYEEDGDLFKFEGGVSYIDNNYATPVLATTPDPDTSYSALRLAYTWEQQLTETLTWIQSAVAFSNFKFNRVNGSLDSRLRTKISESVSAEVRWVSFYNNDAPLGVTSTDNKWIFSVVWEY